MKKITVALLTAAVLITGCATKNYGRQGQVTDAEKSTMTCREIALEIGKVNGYLKQVEKESSFDVLSIASFLGDFGIGNTIEYNRAIDAANQRTGQLNYAWIQKGCADGAIK